MGTSNSLVPHLLTLVALLGAVGCQPDEPLDPPSEQPRSMRTSEVFSIAGDRANFSRAASGIAHLTPEPARSRGTSAACGASAAWGGGAGQLRLGQQRIPLNPGITQIELGKANTARGHEMPSRSRRAVANTVIRFLPPARNEPHRR